MKMRIGKTAIFWIALFGLMMTVMAQTGSQQTGSQQTGSQKDKVMPATDQFEDAHQGMISTQPDKGKEVGQFTQDVAKSLPAAAASAGPIARKNYIDEYLLARMERDGVPHAPLSTDEEYLRRVYVDLTGMLPSSDTVRQFVASKEPNKRDQVIDSLVGTDLFAEEWAWYYGDLFRLMAFSGPKDASQYFFKEFLQVDRPYNDVVTDIIVGSAKSHSAFPQMAFLGRIGRSGALKNRDLTDPDNYASNVNRLDGVDEIAVEMSRIFLGVNIECISCHDGAGHLDSINLYLAQRKREEFSQQAAFFGNFRIIGMYNNGNGDNVYDDEANGYHTGNDAPFFTESESRFPRTGQNYEPKFYLTGETPRPGVNPRRELARMITTSPQFSRTTVNMIWGKLMGVAFVEPWDGWDLARNDPKNPPAKPWTLQQTNPELLEKLAVDFREHNYSMQYLIKTILKSNVYQLSSQFPGEWKDDYTSYYPRKYARVMTGPEVVDTVAEATGKMYKINYGGVDVERVKQLTDLSDVPASKRGLRGYGAAAGPESSSDGADINAIMNSFFETNRQTPLPPGNKPTALQAMLLMRTRLVKDRVLADKGTKVQTLLASGKSDQQVIEECYLSTLGRWPSASESKIMLDQLQKDRKTGVESLQWYLLNSVEFVLNH